MAQVSAPTFNFSPKTPSVDKLLHTALYKRTQCFAEQNALGNVDSA